MGRTKEKLRSGQVTFGSWIMIGHPVVAELLAGEGFDWVCVDMEHTSISVETFQTLAVALKSSGCDIFVRLHSCDPVQAKLVLDAGANGIIVPMVNSREQAEQAVAMAKFPPDGTRGASFCRAADFGRGFERYYREHNDDVCVIAMLEDIKAVENADDIVSTPGLDGALIGPYDLSSSMGLAGQIDHPDMVAAESRLLAACTAHKTAAGLHVVPIDPRRITERIEKGYTLIACSVDTQFLLHGCRAMLDGVRDAD